MSCVKNITFNNRFYGIKLSKTTNKPKIWKLVCCICIPHHNNAVFGTEKTQSIDVTVANLLEGVVKFVPEENRPSTSSTSRSNQVSFAKHLKPLVHFLNPYVGSPKAKTPPNVGQKSFSRNPSDRHLSLQERKEAFVKRAREAYLKKHGFM